MPALKHFIGAALSAVMAATVLSLANPARAEIYGLHVGINTYHAQPSLKGAVADAQDIAQALRAFGATETTVLLEQEATRAAIKSHWERLIDQVGSGDVIVFSYSGHGGQENDLGGDEIVNGPNDDKDEVLILSDYLPQGSGLNERIIDDQLNFWFQGAINKGASVVFVADSCWSGTMSRSGGAGNRLAVGLNQDAQAQDSLPELSPADSAPPPPNAMGAELFFLSSSAQNHPVPEVLINDQPQPRGVMSYVFARALEGAADKNNDGVLMRDELRTYMYQTVESLDDTGQSRALLQTGHDEQDSGGIDRVVMRRPHAAPPQRPITRLPSRTGIRLQVRPKSASVNVRRAQIVDEEPKLIYNAHTGDLQDHEGFVIARSLNEDALQRVIDKYHVLRRVGRFAERSSLPTEIYPRKQTYAIGERPFLTMGPSDYAWMLVFNLASNGQTQQVFPYHPSEYGSVSLNRRMTIQTEVQEPTGADHLIVLSSGTELTALRQAVENGASPDRIVSFLRNLATRDDISAAILPFYTERR